MERLRDEAYSGMDDPGDELDLVIDEDDPLLDHEDPTEEMVEAILEYGGPEMLADGTLHHPLPDSEQR